MHFFNIYQNFAPCLTGGTWTHRVDNCESNIFATWLFGTMLWHLHYDIIYDLMCFINIFKNLGSTEIRTRIAGFRVQSANHYTIEPLVWRHKKSLQLWCKHTCIWLWNLYIITFCMCRFNGVMVSTLDFESSDPSSNLGRTWIFFIWEHFKPHVEIAAKRGHRGLFLWFKIEVGTHMRTV